MRSLRGVGQARHGHAYGEDRGFEVFEDKAGGGRMWKQGAGFPTLPVCVSSRIVLFLQATWRTE